MELPLLAERMVGGVRYRESGEFCPTLVIGLGGSGTETARRVKRIVDGRYGHLGLIRYLFVDTDQAAYSAAAEQAPTEPAEQASVVARNATAIYEEMKRGLRPEIADFLPDGVDVSILEHADGAGGIRPAGRFALFSQFQSFYYEHLEPACRALLDIRQLVETVLGGVARDITIQEGEPRVYLLCSVCGGTGSSAFLDVALLVRHAFQQNGVDPAIVGLFYLPSVFRNERGVTTAFRQTLEANAHAALMELEHFCDPGIRDAGWSFRYPTIGSLAVDRPVFDECYLVEGTNADGRQLGSKQEVFEMTARTVCVDIGSPVGARIRSARRNTVAVLRTSPCVETGKYRLMNSLATTGLRVPVEEIGRYGCLHAAREVIRDRLIGPEPAAEPLEAEVAAFLAANGLEERGDQDQILDRLLEDADGNLLAFRLGRTREELEREAEHRGMRGEAGKARFAAEWVGSRLDRLRGGELDAIRARVRENQATVLRKATDAIRDKVLETARTRGLTHADALVQALLTVFDTAARELTEEAKRADESHRLLENDIQEKRTFLNEYGTLIDVVFRSGEDERAIESLLELVTRYGSSQVRQAARAAALELLAGQNRIDGQSAVLPCLQEWSRRIREARDVLHRAEQLVAAELGRKVASGPAASTYVLEQHLVPPAEYHGYCLRAGLDAATLAGRFWDGARSEANGRPLREIDWIGDFRANPESLIDRIASGAAPDLIRWLEQHAGLLQVIQEKRQASEDSADYVRRQFRLMFQAARPFWSTSAPIGMASYETFVAVTLPARLEDPAMGGIRAAIEEVVREAGAIPEMVVTGYPFALEISTRAYGARAYYLRSTARMKQEYEARVRQGVRDLLHIDRRFGDRIPPLHPDREGQARLLFAWGVAWGYIARRGDYYYLGVAEKQVDGQRLYAPKYRSEEETVIAPNDPAWGGPPQQDPDRSDLLGRGRSQAMEAFGGRADRAAELMRAFEQYVRRHGTQRVVADLDACLKRLDERIARSASEELRHQYRQERELLDRYRLRLLQSQA